jgi:hypothetical protein
MRSTRGNGENVPVGSGVPSLTDDKVTGVGELDRVAVVGGLEVDVSTRLVVLVVVLALHEVVAGRKLKIGRILDSSRSSQRASGGGQSEKGVGNGNHLGLEK